jgi:hypothetical protein
MCCSVFDARLPARNVLAPGIEGAIERPGEQLEEDLYPQGLAIRTVDE